MYMQFKRSYYDCIGGDCQTTVIPIHNEIMDEEEDYPYEHLSDYRKKSNNRIKLLNILHNRNKTDPTRKNNDKRIMFETLHSHNFSTLESVYPLYDLRSSNITKVGMMIRDTNIRSDKKEYYKGTSTKNIREPLYPFKFSNKTDSGIYANRSRRSKRYVNDNIINTVHFNRSIKSNKFTYSNQWKHNTRGLDTYAKSLIYVNKIYNAAYGLERRRVPAHMPHLIDKWIVYNMQKKFEHEFKKTSSHKVRDPEDMQFAFSYFYFLSSEKRKVLMEEIFDMFDTDKSR